MELPGSIPIFPLPNVVLFPEVPLPLHVFEPRYRAMVRDALAGSRLIGMTLLRPDWEADYAGAPDVYRVGCAGRIVDVTPLDDGKFNILLAGLREFEVTGEERDRAYRRAAVIWREAAPALTLPPDLRADLFRAVEQHVGATGRALASEMAADEALDDGALVNFFAFWLDLRPVEKQALLEERGVGRARRLLEVLEFQRHAARLGADAGTRRVH
jgi:hypothetical protein